MSDNTLLTRDEVSKWHNTAGDRQVHIPEGLVDRLLKTVDAAHGVLREEMRAALKGQLELLLAEKEAQIERLQREATEQSSRLGNASRMVIETMKENGELKLKLLELEEDLDRRNAEVERLNSLLLETTEAMATARREREDDLTKLQIAVYDAAEKERELEAERREHSRTRERLTEDQR